MTSAQEFVRQARMLVGTPWLHQGRTALGVDCIGLIDLAARNCGLDIFAAAGCPKVRRYGRKADQQLYTLVARHYQPASAAIPASVALFRFPGEDYPRHFGIITFDGTMIHAEAKTRCCVVEHGYRAQWVTRTDSIWLVPGVRYE